MPRPDDFDALLRDALLRDVPTRPFDRTQAGAPTDHQTTPADQGLPRAAREDRGPGRLRRGWRVPLSLLLVCLVVAGVVTAAIGPARARATAEAVGTCSVAGEVDGWSEGTLHLQARSLRTGNVLVERNADVGTETGSTMKVITAAAALTTLGPDTRIATRVVAGTTPDTVVLVGGGDPTLTRLPSGQQSVYPDAPHLDDLARQVRAARADDRRLAGVPIRRLQVDTSLFTGPAWHPSWDTADRTGGSMSNITALMVDGDRDDPTAQYSRRSGAAVGRAAAAFAALLGPDVQVDLTGTRATPAATTLGSVRSASVADLVRYDLTQSDDTLAETLARLVAVKAGTGSTFAAIQGGTTAALRAHGIPTAGLHLVDGSGLSSQDRVSADVMTRLMALVAQRTAGLGPVDEGLAVAGETGTLAEHGRFRDDNRSAKGHIRGKTGTLDDMYGLTGVTDPVHGDRVVFTIWAEGTADPSARAAIDDLATAMYHCGGALTG